MFLLSTIHSHRILNQIYPVLQSPQHLFYQSARIAQVLAIDIYPVASIFVFLPNQFCLFIKAIDLKY